MPKQTKEPPNPRWTNVLHHFAKSTLENLHEQLFGVKAEGKNKLELADSVAVHRLGIEVLKKQSVYVDQLRDALVRNAGLNAMEAKTLKKDELIDKLRRGELQVESPSPAGVAAAISPSDSDDEPRRAAKDGPRRETFGIGVKGKIIAKTRLDRKSVV